MTIHQLGCTLVDCTKSGDLRNPLLPHLPLFPMYIKHRASAGCQNLLKSLQQLEQSFTAVEGCVPTSGKHQLHLAFIKLYFHDSYQKPVTPEVAHAMGVLYSATSWSSALLSWALSSFLPLHELKAGCFHFCCLASETCRFRLPVLSCWLHGPCWETSRDYSSHLKFICRAPLWDRSEPKESAQAILWIFS